MQVKKATARAMTMTPGSGALLAGPDPAYHLPRAGVTGSCRRRWSAHWPVM